MSLETPTPPTGCRARLVENNPDRAVFAIRAGGPNTKSLGWLAFVWNVIMFSAAAFMVHTAIDATPLIPLFVVPILTLFLVVGLWMAGAWFSMRFTRWNLQLTREELALQRVLPFRKSIQRTELNAESKAQLVESYSQDGQPVYCVNVNGTQRNLTFATALGREDKHWLATVINQFLGAPESTLVAPKSSKGSVVDFSPLQVSELPEHSLLETADSGSEELVISSPIASEGSFRSITFAMCVFVFALWGGFAAILHIPGGGLIHRIVGWIFVVLSLLPILVIAALYLGRIAIRADEKTFRVRFHLGVLGWSFSRPIQRAEQISIHPAAQHVAEDTLAGLVAQFDSSQLLCGWGSVRMCGELAGVLHHFMSQHGIEARTRPIDEGEVTEPVTTHPTV